jgi:hypothetical protein
MPYDIKSTLAAALLNSIKTCDAEIAGDGGVWHKQFWADRRKDYAEAKAWLDTAPTDWSARSKGVVQEGTVPA